MQYPRLIARAAGTGTGIASIVVSALRTARLGESRRDGQIFATDLGGFGMPLLDIVLTEAHSICHTHPFLQHNFQFQVFHPIPSTPHFRLG